ncbi:TPA: hypothetical protein ACHKFH_005125, partial [Escherichia coli]
NIRRIYRGAQSISAFASWDVLCIFYLLFKYVYKECIHYANEACKEESPEQGAVWETELLYVRSIF